MTANTRTEGTFRVEEDALGKVEVPADHLWGAQTQRSHLNFPIGVERYRWGRPVIRALGILKKCAALANGELGQLPPEKVDLIVRAAQGVIDGKLDRDARDPRPGDFGLGGAARRSPGRARPELARRVRPSDRRDGGRHWAERRPALRRGGGAQDRRGYG